MPARLPRTIEFALFLTACLWTWVAKNAAERAANGFALRFNLATYESLLSAVFLLFLVLCGYTAMHWLATRNATVRGVNALPFRSTRLQEWTTGAILGWGLAIVALLPMALVGDLHPSFWFQPRGLWLTVVSLAALGALTLAQEVVFRGYLFIRLIRALGPTLATLLMALAAAFASVFHPHSTILSIFGTFVMAILFALAYLRTHALWLGWGLHFAWSASVGVLFGLPVVDSNVYSAIVDTSTRGALWVTGGLYGPEGALFTSVAALCAMALLYRQTRDLAWEYTHAPIVAAGYAMDIAPPAAHTAMEQAAKPAPLVQILTSTPTASSTMPVVEEHLRSQREPEQ